MRTWRRGGSLPGLPGIVPGVVFRVELSKTAVALFLRVLPVVALPMNRFLQSRRIAALRIGSAGVAVLSAFLSRARFGVAMMPGPFPMRAGFAGKVLMGPAAASGFLRNAVKAVAAGTSPLLSVECARVDGAMGRRTIPGRWLCRWIGRHASIRVHALILEEFIALGAVCLHVQGLSA